MGLLSKLHLSSKKTPKGDKKTRTKKPHNQYESEDVAEVQRDQNQVGPAQLVVGDAPQAPQGGTKGFQDNTNYAVGRETSGKKQDAAKAQGGNVPVKGSKKATSTATASDHPSDAIASSEDQKGGAASAPGLTAPGKAQHAPTVPDVPDRGGLVIQAGEVVKIGLLLWALWALLVLKWLHPGLLGLLSSLLVGVGAGSGAVFLFYYNTKRKRALNDGLNMTPGVKGLKKLLGAVPSWVTFQEREKVEWFNQLLGEVWPFYDRAICEMIKETVEPIMDQYKPAGLVSKLYFKTLTFGDAPMQIDNIWVEQEGENHVMMEIQFRWAGDANIAICVELLGDITKIVPRVTDLRVGGTMRVILAPLCDTIPCFGAAVISLRTPPLIHFNLDFAGVVAGAVKAWLDPFLRETLVQLLVWPNRIVVPLLPESATGPLDTLFLKHEGLLVVQVIGARDLKKADVSGKADPLVVLWTQHVHKQETKHKSKTLEPEWGEVKYCLVQEPKTQNLRVEVHDYDTFNPSGLVSSLNVIKNAMDSFGAHEFMARSAVPIRQFADHPGEGVEVWEPLGEGAWWDDEGTGKGCGEVHLKCWYWPFDMLYERAPDAQTGAVLVHLKKAEDCSAADDNGLSDPYCKLTLNKEMKKSMIQYRTLDPVWDEKYDWSEVSIKDMLEVRMFDCDKFTGDDALGLLEVRMKDVADAPNGTLNRKYFLADVPPSNDGKGNKTDPARTSITLEMRWVPYITPEDAASTPRKHHRVHLPGRHH